MNLGVSGIPFCGPDVGGFAHDTTGQLLLRWTQVGTFTPYFRNHSVLDSIRQEPWSFGEDYEKVIKKYIQERYVWLPYLYTLFKEASVTGVPVMRPLVLEYPGDQHTFNLSDQFMIGSNVIVAPILKPDTYHRVVYLPKGNWINYWTEETLEGGKHHLIEADLETLPIFVQKGAILTHGTVKQSTKIKESELIIHLYPTQDEGSTFTYYEDDGKTFSYNDGQYFECKFEMKMDDKDLDIVFNVEQKQFAPDWQKARFVIHGLNGQVTIKVNGKIQTELMKESESTVINIPFPIEQ
jgi:alpha-glucosidase